MGLVTTLLKYIDLTKKKYSKSVGGFSPAAFHPHCAMLMLSCVMLFTCFALTCTVIVKRHN